MNKHGQKMGAAILPDMMRWLWRDQPVSTDPRTKPRAPSTSRRKKRRQQISKQSRPRLPIRVQHGPAPLAWRPGGAISTDWKQQINSRVDQAKLAA